MLLLGLYWPEEFIVLGITTLTERDIFWILFWKLFNDAENKR